MSADDIRDTSWDVIVIGAGPAGSLAAHQIASHGARVLLVDKKAFPRWKVCGACLNGAAVDALKQAGLEELAGTLTGNRLDLLELRVRGRSVTLPLPSSFVVSRTRLDAELVNRAILSGALFLPGTTAALGPCEGNERSVFLGHGETTVTARGRVVLVASGLAPLRMTGNDRIESRASRGSRLGVGCVVSDAPASYVPGSILMAVAAGGYVGLVRTEDGSLNVAAALDANVLSLGRGPASVAREILRAAGLEDVHTMESAAWQGTLPLTRQSRSLGGERFFVLGDAAGYVEPFTGEGIAWALVSGVAVRSLALEGLKAWNATLPSRWALLHRKLVGHRQPLCRALASLLRYPRLAGAAFQIAGQVPFVAGMMIGGLNRPAVFPSAS